MLEALFRYEFLQYAVISGLLIGLIAPMIGLFIVVRRLALIADALSHVALAGIAGSLYLSQQVVGLATLNPIYLGIGSAVGGSLLIERLRKTYKDFEELAIPIILSTGIGLGAIFISMANGFGTDLVGYLFGSVSAVSFDDLLIVIAIAIVVIGFIALFYEEMFALSFDQEYAKVSGVRGKWIQPLFMVLTAFVIGASMRIVGILLVSSLMTIPVAIAMQWKKSFRTTLWLAVFFGELSVIIGLIIAFYADIAPGGTIVMTSVVMLLLTLGWQKIRTWQNVRKSGGFQ